MPEGHVIHRAARLQGPALGDGPIAVTSPHGRFFEVARVLDGHRITEIEAVGKHLFYHWDRALILHVHLGLTGGFRIVEPEQRAGRDVHLAMTGDKSVFVRHPKVCMVIDALRRKRIVDRLGPDLLDPDSDPAPYLASMQSTDAPIGATLLDQSVVAGIGNVYRAEILFLHRIDPLTPSNTIGGEDLVAVWETSRRLLTVGEKLGRIVTMSPRDVGVGSPEEIPKRLERYVYKRTNRPCYRCSTPIAVTDIADRPLWFCPTCQSPAS